MVYGRSEAMETGNMRMGTGTKWTKPTWTSEETKTSQNVCLCMNEKNPSAALLWGLFHHFSVTHKRLRAQKYLHLLFFPFVPSSLNWDKNRQSGFSCLDWIYLTNCLLSDSCTCFASGWVFCVVNITDSKQNFPAGTISSLQWTSTCPGTVALMFARPTGNISDSAS